MYILRSKGLSYSKRIQFLLFFKDIVPAKPTNAAEATMNSIERKQANQNLQEYITLFNIIDKIQNLDSEN